MKKALFWDFDGTLIHPNEAFLDSLQSAFKSCRYEITPEDTRAFLHSACSWYFPEITYAGSTGQKWWDTFFQRLDSFCKTHKVLKEDIRKINFLFKNRILDPDTYTLFPDSVAVLRECMSMEYKNYIISNNYPELPLVMKGLGLSEYFTDYIVSSNIGYEKPRTEIFRCALKAAGSPDICYMIGDNPIADIQGGKAAGMKTILVHKNNAYDSDYRCDHLLEIPLLLTP